MSGSEEYRGFASDKERITLKPGINVVLMPEVAGEKKTIPWSNKWFSGEVEVTTPTIDEATWILEQKIESMKRQAEDQGGKLIGFTTQEVLVDGKPVAKNFAIFDK